MENEKRKEKTNILTYKGAVYGAFAGFIATWSISTVIAASEVVLGLQISTFYSIMGISLGLNNVITAAYMGFGLHLLTGTIIGAVLGAIGIRWKKIRMLNPLENTLTGMGAGIVIWLVLFLPLTSLFIQPSIQRIVNLESELQYPLLSEDMNQLIQKIALGAIAFHLIWGAIFSYIMRSLVRIREFKIRRQQQ
ncbi:MAG TPA: hypothetical protein VE445_03630 [Nitrososphaeraceae archaeon]|nr:hypothetical protein [Nitrososphaeraceae archaeon]